jgi:hypothetical protein
MLYPDTPSVAALLATVKDFGVESIGYNKIIEEFAC